MRGVGWRGCGFSAIEYSCALHQYGKEESTTEVPANVLYANIREASNNESSSKTEEGTPAALEMPVFAGTPTSADRPAGTP